MRRGSDFDYSIFYNANLNEQRGHSGDGCDLASTLCKYDLRKGD